MIATIKQTSLEVRSSLILELELIHVLDMSGAENHKYLCLITIMCVLTDLFYFEFSANL